MDLISGLGAAICKWGKSANKYGDVNESFCLYLFIKKTKWLLFYIFHSNPGAHSVCLFVCFNCSPAPLQFGCSGQQADLSSPTKGQTPSLHSESSKSEQLVRILGIIGQSSLVDSLQSWHKHNSIWAAKLWISTIDIQTLSRLTLNTYQAFLSKDFCIKLINTFSL